MAFKGYRALNLIKLANFCERKIKDFGAVIYQFGSPDKSQSGETKWL